MDPERTIVFLPPVRPMLTPLYLTECHYKGDKHNSKNRSAEKNNNFNQCHYYLHIQISSL